MNSRRRRRVNKRFYVTIAAVVLLIAIGLSVLILFNRSQVVLVERGVVSDSNITQAFVLRDEQVIHMENYGKIEYYAAEGESVVQYGAVATVYRQGYSETQVQELDTVRQQIYEHQLQLLGDVVDKELSDIEGQIIAVTERIAALEESGENVILLQRELNGLLAQRTERLKTVVQADETLTGLYERETQLTEKIAEWVVGVQSPANGIVSYYLDGYERQLSADEIASYSPGEALKLLQPAESSVLVDERIYTKVYRLISPEHWFLVIRGSEQTFVTGAAYSVTLPDVTDGIYTGQVALDVGEGKDRIVVLYIQQPVGAVINARQVDATIGVAYEGLKVPVGALRKVDGVWNVYLADAATSTAVPVNVVFEDGKYAIIQEKGSEGLLAEGTRILSR